ncbi:MAG TPA: hypothetical protein VMM35_05295 [Longimicrobiales bacterium]|nr:hypothetical protein [Longimicrobiales bacterium]
MLGGPDAASAQLVPGLPISVELRTGASLPLGDFRSENPGLGAGTGIGAAVAIHVHLTSRFTAYGSYDYRRFGCGACAAVGFEDRLPEAGFEAGIEWLPFRPGGLDPWLGAGALIGRRLEIPDGGDGFASESATGWSLGAGVRVPVARSMRLLPGIRYRSYSANFDFPDLGFGLLGAGAPEQEAQVTSLALEVGLSYEF